MNTSGTKPCLECGKPVGASNRFDKKFCCTGCGTAWNNRRKQRGAELYDLFMTMRFDRATAKEAGVWAIMCRMASNWNAEDKEAGLRSYSPAKEVLERSVQHVATRHSTRRGR